MSCIPDISNKKHRIQFDFRYEKLGNHVGVRCGRVGVSMRHVPCFEKCNALRNPKNVQRLSTLREILRITIRWKFTSNGNLILAIDIKILSASNITRLFVCLLHFSNNPNKNKKKCEKHDSPIWSPCIANVTAGMLWCFCAMASYRCFR